MPSSWPLSTDLSALLSRAGITAPTSPWMDAMLEGAAQQVGRETGYLPYLAETQTRLYDPGGTHASAWAVRRGGDRILRLDGGLISVTTLKIAGVLKVVNDDYYLRPANAPRAGRPYEWVEFAAPVFGNANAIEIVGRWGFGETIPMDAWFACLHLAGVYVIEEIKQGKLVGLIEMKELDVTERSGELTLLKAGQDWAASASSRLAKLPKLVTAWL